MPQDMVLYMHRWKLRELMSRHKIKNGDLADLMGKHVTSISRLKSPDFMPQMNGKEFDKLCDCLTIALKNIGVDHVVTHDDLLEYVKTDPKEDKSDAA